MLDLRFIREHTDDVRKGAEAKGLTVNLDEILALDERRRVLIQEGEALKAQRNKVSAQIGKQRQAGQDASVALREMGNVKDRIQTIDGELRDLEGKLNELLLTVPNLPHPSVPVGSSPEQNKEMSRWGELPVVDFPLKPHWQLAEHLGIIDFARGARVMGAGFP
jgi:seryl-tRNA synthetase